MARKLKTYKVESYSSWYLIRAYNKKSARKDSETEWGTTGMVKAITEATESEIEYFTEIKGFIDEAEEWE